MTVRVPATEILGVPVSRVTMVSSLAAIEQWLVKRESHYVCACDVHSLMRARHEPSHLAALRGAGLVTPDGQPVVWTARWRGISDMARVCGPDLMPQVCRVSLAHGAKHYFIGGAPGVAVTLADKLAGEFPGMQVVGVESPPFRALSAQEDQAMVARIVASGANILWLGLGCPKQEHWMHAHRHALPGVIMFGVGAAFDFHTNRVQRAPVWMRDWGLEWLHRLISEPRRLWRRYLVLAPQFVVASVKETAEQRLRQFRRR